MSARRLGFRLLGALVGSALAFALALAAAHYYSAPDLNGASRTSFWLEPDFDYAAASSLVAVGVALSCGAAGTRARLFGTGLLRTLIWFGLTVLLVAAWGNSLSLLTLMIAPSHALACLRVASLWRSWRTESLFQDPPGP